MVTWLPLYLADVRHIPLSETGMIASLVAWTSVPAALLIGRLSDKIGKRKPFLLILIPVAIASIVSLVHVQEWDLLIAALVAYGLFGKLACDPIILTLISDAARRTNSLRSTVSITASRCWVRFFRPISPGGCGTARTPGTAASISPLGCSP